MLSTESLLLVVIFIIGGGALLGIFLTKSQGFGKYTTSVILLTLVLVVSAMLLAAGRIDASLFANIAFAVAGFGGGLVAAKVE